MLRAALTSERTKLRLSIAALVFSIAFILPTFQDLRSQEKAESNSPANLRAVYSAGAGELKKEYSKSFTSSESDLSAVRSHDGGVISLNSPTILTTGESSNFDRSNSDGLNAAVLADSGAKLNIEGGNITTTGLAANGVFSARQGTEVFLSNLTIKVSGVGAHGVVAAGGGFIKLNNLNIQTTGIGSAAVATDSHGGKIFLEGGTYVTTGYRSPSVYSVGTITISHATMVSTGAEAAVVDGPNSLTIFDSSLIAEKYWGVLLYQLAGDIKPNEEGHFNMRSGSLSVAEGPLFSVTNTRGTIELNHVRLTNMSGVLLKASAGQFGTAGKNGGHAHLVAKHQQLPGDLLVADDISSIDARLEDGSSLAGSIRGASISLDSTSKWFVQADSKLTALSDEIKLNGELIPNLIGNGHTVTYDTRDQRNQWLGGKSYLLPGNGRLIPASTN